MNFCNRVIYKLWTKIKMFSKEIILRQNMSLSQRHKKNNARRVTAVGESDSDYQMEVDVPGTSNEGDEVNAYVLREQVQDVLQYLLAGTTSRGFVREMELRKVFGAQGSKERRDVVMKAVHDRFQQIFGLKLYYDEENQRYYLGSELRNIKVDVKTINDTEHISDEAFKDGLLISALMFIFMAKRHVIQDEPGVKLEILKEFLSSIEEIPNDVFAKFFGPSRVADFLCQGWLNVTTKREANGEETILYDWGSRAETVVNKRKLLESFCDLHNCQLSEWPRHASEAGIRVNI